MPLGRPEEAKAKGVEWSPAALNCVLIFGPPIHPLTSLNNGGMSIEPLWKLVGGPDTPESVSPYYVDVRDAAEARYRAAIKHAQGRYIISAGQLTDKLPSLYPSPAGRFARGVPGKYMYSSTKILEYTTFVFNEKSKEKLDVEYRPKDETVKDALDRFFELEQQGLR
ncbi:hypothetical protein L202_01765 [Cryptococcus amylolentus CBS 6039]|uniref:Uncharacterized protein n=1 Tax=Cryptococcus amylolentus CBS 6039 TaxID=1295533 RepID=A0A1E3I559_9TREE|nr:hypothetical protein L202_01765 [Cryptococcus amylolentus CBS 6039]ODN83668.1 hypothetical protein L202_01765 [Cryptococcus amylolentus CBS 6039]